MRYNKLIILIGLILLFLILRLSVLFSYLPRLYEPEELYRGTIAREIIQGPLIPLWEYIDYKVEYFPPGVLVVGILAVPFFRLLGQTYIALKLVGLSFALGTFIVWYFFLEKLFSQRLAVICGILFVFCMPFYTKTSLITWGAHPEANLFTISAIFIFFLAFFGPGFDGSINYIYGNRKKYFFWLGVLSGFSLWFVQTYLFTLFFLLLIWLIFDKRFFLKKCFFIFCFAFIIGFSPGIYYAFTHSNNIFSINGENHILDFLLCDLNKLIPKSRDLFIKDLPNSFLFDKFLNIRGEILSYAYYSIFIAAISYLAWRNRKVIIKLFFNIIYPITLKRVEVIPQGMIKEVLIIAFPLVFFLVYTLSFYSISAKPWNDPDIWPYYIGYRYMIPVMPFILVIIGIFIDKVKANKITFVVFFTFALTLGIIGNLSMISVSNFGKFFKDRGYSYGIIGDKIGLRIRDGLSGYIKPFDKLEENLRINFYEGLGSGISWRLKDKNIEEVINIFNSQVRNEYQPFLYRGWGSLFFPGYPEELKQALYIANRIEAKYRPYFYEGIGRNINLNNIKEDLSLADQIENKYRQDFYTGVGYGIGFGLRYDAGKQAGLAGLIEKQYQRNVEEGIIQGMKDS